MTRHSMLIDTYTCIGCQACSVACKTDNGTPPGMWFAPVIDSEHGEYPDVRRLYLPLLCMHCEDPACVRACPSGAIARRPDGIVTIDQDKCCGSRACMVACPHGAISFYKEPDYYFGEPSAFEEMKLSGFQAGTAQKCNLCAHRVDQGLRPACVDACPTGSRIFGDLEDPTSEIARRVSSEATLPLASGAFTKPGVKYTTRGVSHAGAGPGAVALPYRIQEVWDLPHAAEFWLLGAGGGLSLASLLFGPGPQFLGLSLVHLLALILVGAAGLVLIADLGKPFRFAMALRNQRTSWISRGAAADFIFMAAAAGLAFHGTGAITPAQAVLTTVSALSGVLVITYPALAMKSFRSVPAWSGRPLPLEFLADGVASGIALIALLRWSSGAQSGVATALLALAVVRLAFWLQFRRMRGTRGAGWAEGDMSMRSGPAAQFSRWGVLWVGSVAAAVCAGAALLVGGQGSARLVALAGAATLVGSFCARIVSLRTGAKPVTEGPSCGEEVA